MNLNDLLFESAKLKGNKNMQPTAVKFGGTTGTSFADENVKPKDNSALVSGLKGALSRKNKNPQGEGGQSTSPVTPNMARAVTAGIIGPHKKGNPNVPSFTPPSSATNHTTASAIASLRKSR